MKYLLITLICLAVVFVTSAQTEEQYAQEIREKYPFIEYKQGDHVSFSIDAGQSVVHGTLQEITEKGVMLEIEKGVMIRYSVKRLTAEAQRMFYREEYDAWVKTNALAMQQKEAKAIEQEASTKRLKELKEFCGYSLGGEVSDSDIIRKHNTGSIVVRAREKTFGFSECVVKVNQDNAIYMISKFISDVNNVDSWIIKIKQLYPELKIRETDDRVDAIYRCDNRVLTVWVSRPLYHKGKIMASGLVRINLLDEDLEPIEEKVTKHISRKYDEMQKTTWCSPIHPIEYKDSNMEFWLEPYVGVFDSGDFVLRIKTRYIGLQDDDRSAKWIFYDKVQFLNDEGKELFLQVKHPAKKTEVESFGVTEWADILVNEDFLKLKDSKKLKVKFYGKYSHEFSLTPEQVQTINDVLNLYSYLKDGGKLPLKLDKK